MRRSIALAGIFLIAAGSIFLIFGMWYASTYGVSADISLWNLLFPEAGGNLFSLISLSSSAIVLGVIFILWAYKLKPIKEQKNRVRLRGSLWFA